MRQIDRASRVPPHEQIAAVLREEIKASKYNPAGPPLPSVTTLSQQWDVARRTANKALKALADEGLIEVVEGMGYFVTRGGLSQK